MPKKKKKRSKKAGSPPAKRVPEKEQTPWAMLGIAIAIVVAMIVIIAIGFANNSDVHDHDHDHDDDGIVYVDGVAAEQDEHNMTGGHIHRTVDGDYWAIPTDDLGHEPEFYRVPLDGISVELLAVRASDDSVRVAFNTCRTCYSSGLGYFVWDNDKLVCQNCDSSFTSDEVGLEFDDHKPWPILEGDKHTLENEVLIHVDFLQDSLETFVSWLG